MTTLVGEAWLLTLAATNALATIVLQFWVTVLFFIVGLVFWVEIA